MADDERPKRPPRKKNTPALPLFPDAYLYDTRHLSLEEHGAYLLLLLAAWRMPDCLLPDDDIRLARVLGISGPKWKRLKSVVMQFWTLENGHWTQKRLIQERKFVEFKRTTNTLAANERWAQHAENKGGRGSERTTGRTSERISPRNAPQPLPLVRALSSDEDNGAARPELGIDFDPVKALFDDGLRVLGAAGVPDKAARSLVGRWRKDHGDDAVALSLAAAEQQHISQPLEWIPKWLAARKLKTPSTSSGDDKFLEAMRRDYAPNKGTEK